MWKITNPTIAFLLGLIVGSVVVRLLLASWTAVGFTEDFSLNLKAELIGILVTVLVVDQLYRWRDKGQSKERSKKNLSAIDNVLWPYFNEIIFVSKNLYVDSLGQATDEEMLPSNLSHIYDITSRAQGPMVQKKIEHYIDVLDKTVALIKELIQKVDVNSDPRLLEVLQSFLVRNDLQRSHKQFKENIDTLTWGDIPGWKSDLEMLEKHKDLVDTPPIDPDQLVSYENQAGYSKYVILNKTIKKNLSDIKEYEQLIKI